MGDGNARVVSGGGVVAVIAYMGGTRGSGGLSSAGVVLEMSVVRGVGGSKRHSLQTVELSQRSQTAVQIVSNPPAPSNGCPIYCFFIQSGHAESLDGWRCSSQCITCTLKQMC